MAHEPNAARDAIIGSPGHLLILGGPGSGKTTIALRKAKQIIASDLANKQNVLFLSFSNAAVQQVLNRTGDILSHDESRRCEVQTYHAFCWNILNSHGYLLGAPRQLSLISTHDAEVLKVGMDDPAWNAEQERLFMAEGRTTFAVFARYTADLLSRSSALASAYADTYPTIILDEFQDTDEHQWRLVRCLGQRSRLIVLADPEQRIFQWIPGVSPTRIEDYRSAFRPTTFDFGTENHRSKDGSIVLFANAVYAGAQLPWSDAVVRTTYHHSRPGAFGLCLKATIFRLWKTLKKEQGLDEPTIAILSRGNQLAGFVSSELDQAHAANGHEMPPLSHDLNLDAAPIAMAGRVIAYMLESSAPGTAPDPLHFLELIADVHASTGTKKWIGLAQRLRSWVLKIRAGKNQSHTIISEATAKLSLAAQMQHVGLPLQDWRATRALLDSCGTDAIDAVNNHARKLRLLKKGAQIEAALAELWRTQGNYRNARRTYDDAMAREQLLQGTRPPAGLTVMNMFKCKGKEFDAVILVEHRHRGKFIWPKEQPPYTDLRRLLRVAITRARHQVRVLVPQQHGSDIL